jgi:hypothetical protein
MFHRELVVVEPLEFSKPLLPLHLPRLNRLLIIPPIRKINWLV